MAAETSVLNDNTTTNQTESTTATAPSSHHRFGSFPNGNLQNLESQLNSIYNSTAQELAGASSRTSSGQYMGQARQNSCYSFTNAGQQARKSYTERQRSQSLPHTNTRDGYVTTANNAAYNFKQTSSNSRLPNYANSTATATPSQPYQAQYNNQYGQNERVAYDPSQQYNCNANGVGYYDTMPQYPNQTPSQPGLPSPAPGTTAPAQSCFGHQHLATARHCSCSNQQCGAHFYHENGAENGKTENWHQCNQRNANGVQNYPAYAPSNYLQHNQYNQNVQNVPEADYNVYNDDTRNVPFNDNASAGVNQQNYNNCSHQHMPMKYPQQQSQYQQPTQPSQQYQQNQYFHNQTDQRSQQQFKTPCDTQMTRPQSGIRSETELQCNVVSQSSLNMRPAAYERTLQYVEQCQMFSVTSTTNQTDSSNMVINDMTSSLNSLLEENKYLQMMQ